MSELIKGFSSQDAAQSIYKKPVDDDLENNKIQEQCQSLLSEKSTLDNQLLALRSDLDKALFLTNGDSVANENSLIISQLLEVQMVLGEAISEKNTLKEKCANLNANYNLLHKRLLKISIANQDHRKKLLEYKKYLKSFTEEKIEKERQLVLKLFTLNQEKRFSSNNPSSLDFAAESEEIINSELFDQAWYLAQYPDVADSKANPVIHYLVSGACEGRNPSSGFDTALYLTQYTDVVDKGVNPLLHYIRYGVHEGRVVL
ncbi:hypothetical protein [Cobetia sp. QF-1]|uniref:hypothetical protein n=1 Tax=Cobetia sp. QF-1 TaxID=1969833 RepID=UPI000B5390C9|nr:hypothetical protein [Cobetia sp. QF-1]